MRNCDECVYGTWQVQSFFPTINYPIGKIRLRICTLHCNPKVCQLYRTTRFKELKERIRRKR